MNEKRFGGILLSFFFRGLLLTVPLTVLIYVLFRSLAFLDQIIPYKIPGLGLLTLLATVTLIGYVGSTVLYQPVADLGHDILQRIPFLKSIYNALTDLMEALVGNKKKFDQPVLVRMMEGTRIEKLGFITSRDLSHIGVTGEKVAVYLPHSFAWSGNLFIVPVENVTLLNAKAGDVMKFILSGGVADGDDQ